MPKRLADDVARRVRALIEEQQLEAGMKLPAERQLAADVVARVQGITFTVYSDGRNIDRTLPFDLIPRIIPLSEWQRTEAGLKQRMRALNLFIGDIYGDQKIVRDKVFPAALLGPAGLAAIRAVLPPEVPVYAVGGAGASNFAEWRKAGADGFGSGFYVAQQHNARVYCAHVLPQVYACAAQIENAQALLDVPLELY